jgi:hypothetical protein
MTLQNWGRINVFDIKNILCQKYSYFLSIYQILHCFFIYGYFYIKNIPMILYENRVRGFEGSSVLISTPFT